MVTDSGLRRVAVHADTAHADLTLPAGVPVAALIGSIVDLMPHRAGSGPPRPYRLGPPGRAPLDGSKTLAQQGIRDGAVLILTRAENPSTEPRFDDPAEQLGATVRATSSSWVSHRLAAALAASGLAGVAGFVAVPGGPGNPNTWLAIAAAGTTAAVTVPSSGCGGPVRTTLCCLAGVAVLAALAGIACAACGISGQTVGAAASVVAIALARVAGRIAVRAGGSPDLLTGLITASAATAALGAAAAAAGPPAPGVPSFVAVLLMAATGTALLLRARSHTDAAQIAALLAGGVTTIGIALLTADRGPWPAAVAATLAGAALVAGFATPDSPLVRRGTEVLEGLALGALVPLACWVAGVYGAARGLGLG